MTERDHRRTRRDTLRLTGSALTAVTGLAGCSGNPPERRTVDMTTELTFDPQTTTVTTGGTVRWVNTGEIEHTVTAYEDGIPERAAYFASGGFGSERVARRNISAGLIGANGQFEHTFDVAGTYEYFCVPHEGSGMTGTVRVK